jgi:hypothetical protein
MPRADALNPLENLAQHGRSGGAGGRPPPPFPHTLSVCSEFPYLGRRCPAPPFPLRSCQGARSVQPGRTALWRSHPPASFGGRRSRPCAPRRREAAPPGRPNAGARLLPAGADARAAGRRKPRLHMHGRQPPATNQACAPAREWHARTALYVRMVAAGLRACVLGGGGWRQCSRGATRQGPQTA